MADLARLIPVRSAVGKLARLPLRLVPEGSVVRVLSGRLRGSRWVVGAGTHGCWLGIYEAEKQKHFVDHIKPGQTVYDIGAHVGFYTLLAARLVGRQGHVFAFEPSPRNIPRLRRHVDINRADNITILPCAVADKPGEMGFEVPSLMLTDDGYMGRLTAGGSVKVQVQALDDLLDAGEIQPAQLVKIDVEGAERLVLEGGATFFTNYKPTIFLATHGQEVHAECCALLRSWGYELSSLDPGADLEHTDEVLAVCSHDRAPR